MTHHQNQSKILLEMFPIDQQKNVDILPSQIPDFTPSRQHSWICKGGPGCQVAKWRVQVEISNKKHVPNPQEMLEKNRGSR